MTIIIDGYIAVAMGGKYRSICASVSGHCLRFIFKICQTVAGTSVMSPFHRFLDYFFPDFNHHEASYKGIWW